MSVKMGYGLSVERSLFNAVVLCLLVLNGSNPGIRAITLEESGPRFLEDWKASFAYSSRVGGKISCRVHGQPKPKIEWVTNDFVPVTNITSVREVDEEGNLYLKPFEVEMYRPEVHAARYRCRAKNSVGAIISPEIETRAVLDTPYEISNPDVTIIRGNTAVLRCSVPERLREFISVTSWVLDSSVNIYPNFPTAQSLSKSCNILLTNDIMEAKWFMMPNGDLYVFNVDASDTFKTFVCRTSHKLTSGTKTSKPARIKVKDFKTPEPLRLLVEKQSDVKVVSGEDIYLPCVAEGSPPITYTWYRERDGIIAEPLPNTPSTDSHNSFSKSQSRPSTNSNAGGGKSIPASPSLSNLGAMLLTQVHPDDGGTYVCRVNNSISGECARVKVTVYAPLRIQVSPQSQLVGVGRTGSIRCLISGSPVNSIEWYKDGKRIAGDPSSSTFFGVSNSGTNSRYIISPKDTLTISSVRPDDAGMYQCFASNDLYSAQDSSQIRLGSILPKLTYSFSQQTLHPGPSVSLKCSAVGNPPPQFHWTLDGFPLPDNERYLVGQYVTIHDTVISHLNISSTRAEDGGLYKCDARNSMGSIQHSAQLNIFGPPFIRHVPPVKAIAGKSLVIQCPVSGHPIEVITWTKGGAGLPVNRMQRVFNNGTLIIDHISKEDEATLTCHAKNRQGVTSSRDIQVKVIVPPKIMPFQFTNHLLREGLRAVVSCVVLEGDGPIDLIWEFEGKPISSSTTQGINIRIPDEFSTTLIIEPLSSAHNGKYTCIAENEAGRESYSSELTVQIPPKWTVEPRDVNVASGQSVQFLCQAEGQPNPSIVWKKATGNLPGEYKDLSGATTGIYYSNGSLRFDHVKKQDEGSYLCEARNGVGSGLSKVVFLKVNAPAKCADRNQQISVRSGEKAILQCRVKGDLPIDIQWSSKSTKIISHSNHRYTIRQQTLEDGLMSELIVANVDRSDSGPFSCFASNSFGTDETTVVLSVQEPPEQPVNLRLLESHSRSVQISWSEGFNGHSDTINFIVQYKFPSDTWTQAEVEELAVPATQTTAVVDSLSPSTTYHLRILAQNGMGFSSPSEVIQVTTEEEAPEGPPQDIEIEPISPTRLKVTWGPPEKHLWHGNLLGFYLGLREVGLAIISASSENERRGINGESSTTSDFTGRIPTLADMQGYHLKTVEVGLNFGAEAEIDDLKKFTRYAVIVQAFNAKGTGPPSFPVIATTLQDVPSLPPENVECRAISSKGLEIKWDNPPLDGRNGIIQGYKVTYSFTDEMPSFPSTLLPRPSSSASSFPSTSDSDTSSAALSNSTRTKKGETESNAETKLTTERELILTGLKKWTNYTISVLAFTQVGDGKASDSLTCRTDEDVPSPPSDVRALVSSRRSILVAWFPPEYPNGRIEKYTIYLRQMDSGKVEHQILQAHENIYEFTNLKEESAYEFWVTASTKIGEGASTSRVHASTMSKVAAKIASFSQSIDAAWKRDVTLLCEVVGVPEPSVQWLVNGSYIEMGSRRNVDVGGKLTIMEVTPENSGNYTCVAENTHGSDSVTYILRVQTPPQPPVLQIAEASYDALKLIWTPKSDGGSPIKGYLINYKRSGGDWEEYEVRPSAKCHLLQGLLCGSNYQVYITAFNKIGSSLPSDIQFRSTKGNAPVAPKKKEKVLHGNYSSISILLDRWEDSGCPIIRFLLEYKTSTEKSWHQVPIEPLPNLYTLNELQEGTKYELRVTAENHSGSTTSTYNFLTLTQKQDHGQEEARTEENDDSKSTLLNTALFIVFPSTLALVVVGGVLFFVCVVRRNRMGLGGGTKTIIGDHPHHYSHHPVSLQTLIESQQRLRNNWDQHDCAGKSTDYPYSSGAVGGHDKSARYKNMDGSDYSEDVCPYATFQLPEKPPGRPVLTGGIGAAPLLGVGGVTAGSTSGCGSSGTSSIGSSSTAGKGRRAGKATSGKQQHHNEDTMYSVDNIYSGPYHSVQSPGFMHSQATLPLWDPEYQKVRENGGGGGATFRRNRRGIPSNPNTHFYHPPEDLEALESDTNIATTDSEVKKIMTLHMPISEYDTLTDSEGEKHFPNSSSLHQFQEHHTNRMTGISPPLSRLNQFAIQQGPAMVEAAKHQQYLPYPQDGLDGASNRIQSQLEMVTFRRRQRSDPAIALDHTSSSTDESSPITGKRKSSYIIKKNKSKTSVQSGSSQQRVRGSSGYSSHAEETSFRLNTPTQRSDGFDIENDVELTADTCDLTLPLDGMKYTSYLNSMSRQNRKKSSRGNHLLQSQMQSSLPKGMPNKQGTFGRDRSYHIDV